MNSPDKEVNITDRRGDASRIAPYMWKKGQSGNPKGRPKGKTMKEWAKEYLERMTDEERDEFMEGIPKEVIWRMSEGNPHSTTDTSIEVVQPIPILGGVIHKVITEAREEEKAQLEDKLQHTEVSLPPRDVL